DIRTEAEFQLDHIKGSTFIPFLDFSRYLLRIEELTNGNRDCPIVLYCRTGRRAGIVKKVLLQEGYTRVTNMGGLNDWRDRNGK
ncbi:MAG: rhodanese-like domain-containing protein, partial [Acidobacteriota bacterium]